MKAATFALCLLLAACGGGGGDEPSVGDDAPVVRHASINPQQPPPVQ